MEEEWVILMVTPLIEEHLSLMFKLEVAVFTLMVIQEIDNLGTASMVQGLNSLRWMHYS